MESGKRQSINSPARPAPRETSCSETLLNDGDDDAQANSTEIDNHDMETGRDVSPSPRNLVGTKRHDEMRQEQLYLEYFHSAIITEELGLIKHLKRAHGKMIKAIQELIRVKGYRSADSGKEYRFKWTDNATYYLLKYCLEIGPFYGFEHLKRPSLTKLEQSSLISLKWSCVWYDLLMTLKFENSIIPTESQIKSKCRYLLDNAHPKLFAVTTGDERNPFSFTGVDKVDNILEMLTRLKNDAEQRKVEIQKLETDRQNNKRTLGQMLCSNSIPSVTEGLSNSDSEEPSSIDDINQPNSITMRRNKRTGRLLNFKEFAQYSLSNSALVGDLQETLKESIEAAAVEERKYKDKEQQRKDQELALKQKKLEISLQHNQHMLELELERQKREQFDHDAKKIDILVKMMDRAKSLEGDKSPSSEALQKLLHNFVSRYT
ncbi:hypothetical protein ACU8KH_03311 [Lachancea thermotolerans]